jgi:hypothetical protein
MPCVVCNKEKKSESLSLSSYVKNHKMNFVGHKISFRKDNTSFVELHLFAAAPSPAPGRKNDAATVETPIL